MSEVIQLRVLRDNLPVEACLNQARNMNLKEVLVVGWTQDGKLFFSASENLTNEGSLWLAESAKNQIMGL